MKVAKNQNQKNVSTKPSVIAVIGAVYSSVSIPVASFFRLFNMPQISFASTSPLLSNRDLYPYFYRTVPPDNHQAQAMIDLIVSFGWDYVSTIYLNNLYGQPGNEFHNLAKANGVCIDFNIGIEDIPLTLPFWLIIYLIPLLMLWYCLHEVIMLTCY